MNKRIKPFLSYALIPILLLIIFLTGCSGLNQPAPTPTQTPTISLPPIVTPPNVIKPSPTETIKETVTPTLPPTQTSSPTIEPPPDDFSKVRLLTFGELPNWQFSITFEFPTAVKGSYYVKTRKPVKTYDCHALIEYRHPERLACIGRVPAVEKTVYYDIFDNKTNTVQYSGSMSIPFQ